MRKSIKHHDLFALLLIFISVVVKFIYVDNFSLWIDEAYTVWFTNQTWHDLWFWVPTFESHPPFYYSLMKVWGLVFGKSDGISFRYASLFLSIFLFIFPYLTLKAALKDFKINTTKPLYLFSALFTFSSILVWYSIEARPYILFSFCYSITLYYTYKIIQCNGSSLSHWIYFSIGAILTNWCHNLGSLYSLAIYIVIFYASFALKMRGGFKKILISSFVVFIFSFPLLLMLLQQLSQWAVASWVPEPSLNSFLLVMSKLLLANDSFYLYLKSYIGGLGAIFIHTLLTAPQIIIFFYGFIKLYQFNKLVFLFFVLSIFFVPAATFIISTYGPNVFLFRPLIPIIIPGYILLSLSVGFIKNKYLSSAVCLTMIISLFFATTLILNHGTKTPWQDITQKLIENTDEDTAILLLPNDFRLPIEIYDPDKMLSQNMKGLPSEYPAIGLSNFYPIGTPSVPGISSDDAAKIDAMITRKSKVLFLTGEGSSFDPDRIVYSKLNEMYHLCEKKEWDGVKLYIFNLKLDTSCRPKSP